MAQRTANPNDLNHHQQFSASFIRSLVGPLLKLVLQSAPEILTAKPPCPRTPVKALTTNALKVQLLPLLGIVFLPLAVLKGAP